MLSVIKTAIITILISFISGLLLDYYKNLAPRILCNIRNSIPVYLNNKKFCAYIITVSNQSNKTIHDLTINIQSSQNNLMNAETKITKGLKFDSSIKDNNLDFSMPFLSKGDEFSVTVYVQNQYEMHKPVITIRSPENFKQINSVEQNRILSLLSNIPKNTNKAFLGIIRKAETIVPNRISMLIIATVILILIAGILGESYLASVFANSPASNADTNIINQSTNATKITDNSSSNISTGGATENMDKKSSSENSVTNFSSGNTARNSVINSSSKNTTGNLAGNSLSENTTENSAANSASGNTTGNSTVNSSSENTVKNSTTNFSSENTTKNSTANSLSENATGNQIINHP